MSGPTGDAPALTARNRRFPLHEAHVVADTELLPSVKAEATA